MGINVRQHTSTAVSGTSQSLTFGSACVAGSVIIALVTSENGGFTGCSDPANGAYTNPGSTHGTAAAFYKENASTSALTVTATFSAAVSGGTISLFEITGDAGTPEFDAGDKLALEDPPPNANRTLTMTTTVSGAAGFACAAAYPNEYIANPDPGWTALINGAFGVNQYHDSEYRADLGAAGAKTVWAAQGVDYAGPVPKLGMVALAFRDPSSTSKKWQIKAASNGVTAEIQVMSGTAAARSVIDQAAGVVSSGGFWKFAVASPSSFSVGTKRFAFVHDYNDDTANVSMHGSPSVAEVIQE